MIKIENNKLNFHGQICSVGHIFEIDERQAEKHCKGVFDCGLSVFCKIKRINKNSVSMKITMSNPKIPECVFLFKLKENRLFYEFDDVRYIELY